MAIAHPAQVAGTNQPSALPLISRQSARLVASIFGRASRASDRSAGHNGYKILATSRIAVQVVEDRAAGARGDAEEANRLGQVKRQTGHLAKVPMIIVRTCRRVGALTASSSNCLTRSLQRLR